MAKKPWDDKPWKNVFVDPTERKSVFEGELYTFDQIREVLKEVDELREQLGPEWEEVEDISAYGDEDGANAEGYYMFVRELRNEEIDEKKREIWEQQEQYRKKLEREREEKDFKQYQELRKKFEKLGENVL